MGLSEVSSTSMDTKAALVYAAEAISHTHASMQVRGTMTCMSCF